MYVNIHTQYVYTHIHIYVCVYTHTHVYTHRHIYKSGIHNKSQKIVLKNLIIMQTK